jgi:SAM-dependent methyltransferase
MWGDAGQWSDRFENGQTWSRKWGSSDAQWRFHLLPRLEPILKRADTIVEIAPGYGRWTQRLAAYATRMVAVDLNANCTEHVRRLDIPCADFEAITNDGSSLPGVADASVDFVFSYDSLVHCDLGVLEGYLGEIDRVLRPGGMAFLHHSNLLGAGHPVPSDPPVGKGGRDRGVSAKEVRGLAAATADLEGVIQEYADWTQPGWYIDCYSTLRKGRTGRKPIYTHLDIARDRNVALHWDAALSRSDGSM